jgi:hypothetical protein
MSEDKSTIINQIFELKEEYHNIKDMIDLKSADGQQLDFQPLYYPDLLRIRKDLSCLTLDLAKKTAKYFRDYNLDEAKRSTQHYLHKRSCIQDKKMKIGEAETEAKAYTANLVLSVATNEGLYRTGKMILDQANEVLASVKQDISIIRKEYESINDIQ